MNWDIIIIILYHLMSAFMACGVGLMVVVVVGSIFEQIADYIPLDTGLSQAELEREIKEIENTELAYELELLLAARRMVGWWKILVLLIVASVVYYEVYYKVYLR